MRVAQDKSGKLDSGELRAALATIGVEGASAKVAKAVIKATDPEGGGEVDYQKFVAALKSHGLGHSPESPKKGKGQGKAKDLEEQLQTTRKEFAQVEAAVSPAPPHQIALD